MNPFQSRTPALSGPATDALPVTPDDGVDLANVAIALYVEGGGAVVVDMLFERQECWKPLPLEVPLGDGRAVRLKLRQKPSRTALVGSHFRPRLHLEGQHRSEMNECKYIFP